MHGASFLPREAPPFPSTTPLLIHQHVSPPQDFPNNQNYYGDDDSDNEDDGDGVNRHLLSSVYVLYALYPLQWNPMYQAY